MKLCLGKKVAGKQGCPMVPKPHLMSKRWLSRRQMIQSRMAMQTSLVPVCQKIEAIHKSEV